MRTIPLSLESFLLGKTATCMGTLQQGPVWGLYSRDLHGDSTAESCTRSIWSRSTTTRTMRQLTQVPHRQFHFSNSSIIYLHIRNSEKELIGWFSGSQYLLLLQKIWVLFLTPTWQFRPFLGSRGPDTLLWPLYILHTFSVLTYMQANTSTHKINSEWLAFCVNKTKTNESINL